MNDAKGSIMNYSMTLDSQNYHIGPSDTKFLLVEQVDKLTDNEGFDIELNNVFLNGIHLKWGKYTSVDTKSYSISPTQDAIVAHFCLLGSCITRGNNNLNIGRGECLLFKEEQDEYLYQMGTDNKRGSFFEVSLNPNLYADLFVGEHQLLDSVMDNKILFTRLAQDHRFYSIISEMYNDRTNYIGKLKKLYLESKVMELLLLQMSYLDNCKNRKRTKLQSRDIEAIHQVKSILDINLEHVSIPQLALSAGINQTKLKAGFKELFGKTIFEYLTGQRMYKASELLKSTNLTITDIAETVGYKHAQHFSVAFQKTYGYLPNKARR